MDNASKEIKEYGMVKTFLPEAGTFERAVPYRENKIKPLFIKMKNQIAALAGKIVELNKMVESWKNKYQKSNKVLFNNFLIHLIHHLIVIVILFLLR